MCTNYLGHSPACCQLQCILVHTNLFIVALKCRTQHDSFFFCIADEVQFQNIKCRMLFIKSKSAVAGSERLLIAASTAKHSKKLVPHFIQFFTDWPTM